MGSKAWDEMMNGGSNDVTSQSLLKEIKRLYDTSYGYQTQAGNLPTGLGFDDGRYQDLNNAAITASNQAGKLKQLLGLVDQGSASSSSNPFSTGGSGGSGAPTVNTSNRFEAGLSDAELRLKNLLDNPDSIQQSAAYKFRVGQGQEALQRQLGAKGLLNSGNRLMELTKYGQDMGSQEYDAQYGRLGSLLGNYSQGYLGDKNANTSRFSAESNAWNQAQGNADTNRYRMASLAWDKQKDGGRVIGSSSGGMRVPAGTLGGMGGDIGMGPTGFGSLATEDDPYNTGFGIRDRFGKVSGRSEIR